jgi:hypothetical protein
MADAWPESALLAEEVPGIEDLITEDDEPVDTMFSSSSSGC